MDSFYEFVREYVGVDESKTCKKYSDAGHSFCVSNEIFDGIYWFYETENFIIDIHDFFIKKELIHRNLHDNSLSKMRKFMSFCSSYMISASGECFNPYQTLSSNSLYVLVVDNLEEDYRFLHHENSIYLSVGINFKKKMIDACLNALDAQSAMSCADIFMNNSSFVTKALEPLAKDILSCKMTSPAAEIFFEAKAREWVSIIIDAFINKKEPSISIEDDKALENVAKYLDDHYAINVSQATLEKISMMSGTKLKNLFKQKYQSSITEYTQRKRMNIAETLILNSSLKIQDIAEAVGYSSHSKFSACFKKYKGVYPRDMRRNINHSHGL